jgi:hypothetical protein
MSMTTKVVLSCLGVFIGGAVGYYQAQSADAAYVLGARFYLGIVMAGLSPLGAYFVGLAQRAPWDGNQPPAPQK